MQLGVHDGQMGASDPAWLKGISAHGGIQCTVDDECVVGSGEGSCTVMVDLAVPIQLGSTDSGNDCEVISDDPDMTCPARFETPPSDITVKGKSAASHWNLCWKQDAPSTHRRAYTPAVGDYCYYVNGICFLWASPCSGGCSSVDLSAHTSFCPTLRYATEAEFLTALPTLNGNRPTFYSKCAADIFDPYFRHCDYMNDFVRVEDNSWNELVLVCPATAPATGGAGGAPALGGAGSAVGDPHLQNIYGERFDLMKPGKHVLVNIPRGALSENALLQVEAEARQMGGKCADMYFQELNITGSWVAAAKQSGGLHFKAGEMVEEKTNWEVFGRVELKVAHGRTKQGIQYLNLYVKHLDRTGLAVGGLLGEDDHSEAAVSPKECAQTLSLITVSSE